MDELGVELEAWLALERDGLGDVMTQEERVILLCEVLAERDVQVARLSAMEREIAQLRRSSASGGQGSPGTLVLLAGRAGRSRGVRESGGGGPEGRGKAATQ